MQNLHKCFKVTAYSVSIIKDIKFLGTKRITELIVVS
jgi:hypothetical protein